MIRLSNCVKNYKINTSLAGCHNGETTPSITTRSVSGGDKLKEIMTDKKLKLKRMEIANSIRKRRKELKMTQIQLAEKSGMGVMTVKRVEDGRFFLNSKQLLILCEALNCDLKILTRR